MYPLFETIAFINGKPQNLAYHQARYEKSLFEFYGLAESAVNLAEILANPTALPSNELVRCRIDYNQYSQQIQFFPYKKRYIRTFQPVICDEIRYNLKFSDRTLLNQLYEKRGQSDEIMLIKQGMITDCTIGNLILKRQGEWFTPDTPLLQGTQRERLLQQQKIQLRHIPLKELDLFDEIRLINAMNGLDE
ncbi:4-amino-4-deoxychorismate lyase [Cricetibacter osteomyelitidis]|uniref:4-amino-4-deoxychorismate lyase n=1 Tax=Cricetibacter osteomyelitidis TaxID=1521931 RepID=A0A4R2T0X0_9PAST|nr:aminotransferase class IV family protein [Cricetibacter osteomyelitidis]TCP95545.1 4-amino-4-deoxychorismate lyase [Cricetibacter osteomyelitidis]